MRTRSDEHCVLAESRPIPPFAYARGGVGRPGEARYLRSRNASTDSAETMQAPPEHGPTAASSAERRRLEGDLHDGVQNELVALIVELGLVQEDARTPPALADVLGRLEARAQAALDFTRAIVRGIDPPLLTAVGVTEALRAQAARAAIDVSIVGTASRSGAGLRNIRERVENLGGGLKVASGPGLGTVVTVSMPWPARADHRR